MTFFFYLYMMRNWFQKKNACVKHMALPFCLCKILQRTRPKCNTTHYWPFLNPNKKLPNYFEPGWQKLCKGTKGLRRKVWTWTKILSTNICYRIAISKFVAIYALFGRLRAKKWQQQCFLGKKCIITWYILQKRRIFRENSKCAPNKSFWRHFCLRRKAISFCHPDRTHKYKYSLTLGH